MLGLEEADQIQAGVGALGAARAAAGLAGDYQGAQAAHRLILGVRAWACVRQGAPRHAADAPCSVALFAHEHPVIGTVEVGAARLGTAI